MGICGQTTLSIGFLLTATATAAFADCSPDVVTIYGDWGQANFKVTIADDARERARGLMNVPQMPTMTGMLFVYDGPQPVSFWMRNTLIPLDMLFIDPAGKILVVHPDAIPLDETSIDGGDGVQYVLEINGGLAARLGIAPGDVIQNPVLGPGAARPCD